MMPRAHTYKYFSRIHINIFQDRQSLLNLVLSPFFGFCDQRQFIKDFFFFFTDFPVILPLAIIIGLMYCIVYSWEEKKSSL